MVKLFIGNAGERKTTDIQKELLPYLRQLPALSNTEPIKVLGRPEEWCMFKNEFCILIDINNLKNLVDEKNTVFVFDDLHYYFENFPEYLEYIAKICTCARINNNSVYLATQNLDFNNDYIQSILTNLTGISIRKVTLDQRDLLEDYGLFDLDFKVNHYMKG